MREVTGRKLIDFCVVASLLFLLAGLLFLYSHRASFCFMVAAMILSYVLVLAYLHVIGKLYLVFLFFLLRIVYELFFLLLYTALSSSDRVFNERFVIHYLDYSSTIYLAFSIPLLAVLVVTPFVKQKRQFVQALDRDSPLGLMHFRITGAVVILAAAAVFSDRIFDVPFASYIARVGHSTFILFAFWIGFWNKRLKILWPIALLVLLAEVLVTIFSGGRFSAFLILALLYFGFIMSYNERSKRTAGIVLAMVVSPFVFYLIGLLGYVRNSIGRGDLDIVTADRIGIFMDAVSESSEYKSGQSALATAAVGRNVKWPNLSVIALSPEVVPYRGTTGMGNELEQIFFVAGLAEGFSVEEVRNVREQIVESGLGTGAANRYGYSVNRMNSVEWSIMADAWSRGGAWMFLVYCLLAVSLLVMIEIKVLSTWKNPAELALLMVVLIQLVWFRTGAVPFYVLVRSLGLSMVFALCTIMLLRVLPRISK